MWQAGSDAKMAALLPPLSTPGRSLPKGAVGNRPTSVTEM